jgi:hypothetical protein
MWHWRATSIIKIVFMFDMLEFANNMYHDLRSGAPEIPPILGNPHVFSRERLDIT